MAELLQQFVNGFGWAPPLVGLSVIAALSMLALLWVWGKTGNLAGMKAQRTRAWAALLELRLYAEEPGASGRALGALFAANLRYLRMALLPALLTLAPMGWLLVHLDTIYGRAPMAVGRDAIVTVRMAPGVDGNSVPELEAPPQVAVTSPAVRALEVREISWRIRPLAAGSTRLRWNAAGGTVDVPLEAGGEWRAVRTDTAVSAHGIERVEIGYPEAHGHWLRWFCGVSLVVALLTKRRLGGMI